jgi:hypothetical protein
MLRKRSPYRQTLQIKFRDATPNNPVDYYLNFGGACFLRLQGKQILFYPEVGGNTFFRNVIVTLIRLHGDTKTKIVIFIAVRISNVPNVVLISGSRE